MKDRLSSSSRRGRTPALRGLGMSVLAAVLVILAVALFAVQDASLRADRRRLSQRLADSLAHLFHERLTREMTAVLGMAADAQSKESVKAPGAVVLGLGRLDLQSTAWDPSPHRPLRLTPGFIQTLGVGIAREGAVVNPVPQGQVVRFVDLPDSAVLVAFRAPPPEAPSSVPVALLDKPVLMASFLVGSGGQDDDLEIVPTAETQRGWSVALPEGLRFWSIQPTQDAVRAEAHLRWRQYLLLGPVCVFSLAAMVALMWRMSRVMRREEELLQMKGDFVAGVSHELKTPLSLIHLFGETLLENRVPSEEKKREYYEIIVRESTRLSHLINNLLDFSKIETGKRPFVLTPQDAGSAVRAIYEAYRHELDHQGVEHELRVAGNLPLVAMDHDAISQAVLNLISNAVKYSEEDKALQIEVAPDTRRGRHGVLISVHDRGIGISPEDRIRVFEGFFRADDPRVRERRGTGLGLTLVKHIIEAHGGSVSAESRLIKGSSFRIFLPAAPRQTAAGSATSGEASPARAE